MRDAENEPTENPPPLPATTGGRLPGVLKKLLIALAVVFVVLIIKLVMFVRLEANKMDASSNVRELVIAYHEYCFESDPAKAITSEEVGGDVTRLAVFLAAKTTMNDPKCWFIPWDPTLDDMPEKLERVADLRDPKHPAVDPLFAKTRPKSWAVVVGIPDIKKVQLHPETYPVIWTRGLGPDGWKPDSPWKGRGGHVAFLDGHVEWFESTKRDDGTGIFRDYLTGQPTTDFRKAIGPGATVLEDR